MMKRFLGILTVAAMLAACNTMSGGPEMKRVAIAPQELKPGDTAVITVEVVDRHAIVDRIEGIVRDHPEITFKLRDDGEEPDQKAGDGVWSLQVDVPFQAPPGEFFLELTAYRSDGQPVPVRDAEGNVVPLQETLPVIIRYSQG